jgi:uncharacterized alkaline shock family protein YloU
VSGESLIASDVVARYAADAACEIDGVTRVVQGVRRGIRVDGESVELHLALRFGVSIPTVGRAVQDHVGAYLEKMADARPATIDVVVDEIDVVS